MDYHDKIIDRGTDVTMNSNLLRFWLIKTVKML